MNCLHITKSGDMIEKFEKTYFDPIENFKSGRLVEIDIWVTDHVAIAVGVRIKRRSMDRRCKCRVRSTPV
jgi:hypothetical protein